MYKLIESVFCHFKDHSNHKSRIFISGTLIWIDKLSLISKKFNFWYIFHLFACISKFHYTSGQFIFICVFYFPLKAQAFFFGNHFFVINNIVNNRLVFGSVLNIALYGFRRILEWYILFFINWTKRSLSLLLLILSSCIQVVNLFSKSWFKSSTLPCNWLWHSFL